MERRTSHLNALTPDRVRQHRERIASGLKTTFKTRFQRALSLREAISPENIRRYGENKTGEKLLIDPSV